MQQYEPLNRPAKKSSQSCCLVGSCSCCFITVAIILLLLRSATICKDQQSSNLAPVAAQYPGGFHYEHMGGKLSPAMCQELEGQLTDITRDDIGNTFGHASAEAAPLIMYKGTKVSGVWEHVPDAMKGVWWMRGNPVPEILSVTQYGHWFDELQSLYVINTPFNWGWDATGLTAETLSGAFKYGAVANLSFTFKPCPARSLCEKDSSDFTYADLQMHERGLLDTITKDYMTWNMEMDPSALLHSLYKRGNYYLCGKFDFFGLTKYDLTKIIDADGNTIEPHYSEYSQFMKDGQKSLVMRSAAQDYCDSATEL